MDVDPLRDAARTVVANANDATSAEVIAGRLRTAGIDALIETGADFAIRPAEGSHGTVSVSVATADVDRATALLGTTGEAG